MILVLLGILLAVWLLRDECFDRWGNTAFLGAVLAVVLGAVGLIPTFVGTYGEPYVARTYELKALGDHIGVRGSFFLGSGTIKSAPYFFWYQGHGGGYILKQAKAKRVMIIEDATGNPRLDIMERELPNEWWNRLFGWSAIKKTMRTGRYYEFHVPPNSIMTNYQLDLQ